MNPKKYAIQLVSRVARANNYHVIADWDIANFPLAQHLRQIFATREVDCVLDVGANFGQYRDLLRDKVGFDGRILSFEPVSHIYSTLAKRAEGDPQWSVFPFALGSAPGSVQINVTKAPSRNSLLSPRGDVVTQFWSEDAVTGLETVKIQTIDWVLSQEGIDCDRRGVYLKMDTQGFDLEVARGAAASLSKMRALQLEASIRPIYHGMPSYHEAIAFMNEAGFDISGMFKVTSDERLRMVEFDCVMVNNRYPDAKGL